MSFLSNTLRLSPRTHSELMIAAPKVLQALFAAVGDYSTWTLAHRVYGRNSNESWAAVRFPMMYKSVLHLPKSC